MDVIREQAQLAGDEVRVFGVAGPGGDVDDVEGVVDEVADVDELGKDESLGRVGGGERQLVGRVAFCGREAVQAELHVLGVSYKFGCMVGGEGWPYTSDYPRANAGDEAFEAVGAWGGDHEGGPGLLRGEQSNAFLETGLQGRQRLLEGFEEPFQLSCCGGLFFLVKLGWCDGRPDRGRHRGRRMSVALPGRAERKGREPALESFTDVM